MINVPLKSLLPGGKIDSRSKANRGVEIDKLANSIRSLGLILPLAVVQEGDDKYRVVDGNRRLEALKIVHKGEKDVQVPVQIHVTAVDQSTARAMSLAANIERLPLHPMDQYEAFAAIAADGKALAEIAATFGLSERHVRQRLALGSLCKEAKEAYRNGGASARLIQMLCRVEPAEQLRLLVSGEPEWRIIQAIENQTAEGAVAPTSGLARFVGRDAYAGAGGTFVTDLFVEEQDQLWADSKLALELADGKIEALRAEVLSEGWQFFERLEAGWVGQDYVLEEPEGQPANLTEEQLARANTLRGRREEIDKSSVDENGEDGYDDDALEELEKIEDELAGIEGDDRTWTDEQKARCGVVLDAHYTVVYGARRREKAKPDDGAAPAEKEAPSQSTAVMMELDAHLTNAVRGALVDDHRMALRLLALTFLSDYFLVDKLPHLHGGVGIRCDFTGNVLPASEYGLPHIEEMVKASGLLKAKNFQEKMKAMGKIGDAGVDEILAFFVARSIMRRHRGTDLVLYLHSLRRLEIRKHFTPTVDNLFGRLTKDQLGAVLREASIPADISGMKKAEAAAHVAAVLPADWVPEAIRPKKPD